MVSPTLVSGSNTHLLRKSGNSRLYAVRNTGYAVDPFLVKLVGDHRTAGFDYAALLHAESSQAMTAFLGSMFTQGEQEELLMFLFFCWDRFLAPRTPQSFLDELAGMEQWHLRHPTPFALHTDVVAKVFYTVANMPADPVNIVAMLEEELEGDWPAWLRATVNDLVKILEKLSWGCDAYGVWGNRTEGGRLFASRNLDWNTDTGLDKFKTVVVYEVEGAPLYATMGFSVGLGALAGMSARGISVSEMNLDNSQVTFSGAPFPLRLRMLLEGASDLASAMQIWNATNNTNSFNFLLGSSSDSSALALETIRDFTQVYSDNSPVEAASFYVCPGSACRDWTNQTGNVRIGRPLPHAVWRSNHAFSPRVMATQESLFNDTVFRYDLQHDLIAAMQGTLFDETAAVALVATLGTKGVNFFSCAPSNFLRHGENVMSVAYAPGNRGPGNSQTGVFYVAWEQGKGSNKPWSPAACNPYIRFDFDVLATL